MATSLQSTTQTQTPISAPGYQELLDQLSGSIGKIPMYGDYTPNIPDQGTYTPNIPQFDFQDYLKQAFGGPQFQQAARGLTGALQPQFAQQRLDLQDQFRAANVLPSSMYVRGMTNLFGQQGQQQNQILSQLAQSMLANSLQAGQLGLQTAMGRENLTLQGRQQGLQAALGRENLALQGRRLGLESALAPLEAQMGILKSMPFGQTQTTTENVDMGALLQLMQQMRGATGGGVGGGIGGGAMDDFQASMGGSAAEQIANAPWNRQPRIGNAPTPRSNSFTPGPGYDPYYGTQAWMDKILSGDNRNAGNRGGDEWGENPRWGYGSSFDLDPRYPVPTTDYGSYDPTGGLTNNLLNPYGGGSPIYEDLYGNYDPTGGYGSSDWSSDEWY